MIAGLAWNILLTLLVAFNPHPKLDKNRCVFDEKTLTKYCWPKDKCWIDVNGDAMCWRVANVGRR